MTHTDNGLSKKVVRKKANANLFEAYSTPHPKIHLHREKAELYEEASNVEKEDPQHNQQKEAGRNDSLVTHR